MNLEINNKTSVSIDKMEDGDIAIVRRWDSKQGYDNTHIYGKLIQRVGKQAFVLGKGEGDSFPSVFTQLWGELIKVEILKEGDLIKIIK